MNTTYRVKRQPGDKDKLAPQETAVFDAIKAQKNPTKEGTVTKLEQALKTGKLKTKQPASRLLAFYQKRLIDKGLISKKTEKEPAKAA